MAMPKLAVIAILVFATGVIAAAWGFQVIGGYQPCGLCYQQRIPYYVGIPLAIVALFLWSKITADRRMRHAALALLTLTFAYSVFLAARHAGVEWDWWEGPGNCAAGDLQGFGDGVSLIEALENAKVAFCDEAALRIMGLSFAGWNFVASLVLTALGLFGLRESLRTR